MRDERVQLLEGALIEEDGEALLRRQLATFVLPRDGFRTPAQEARLLAAHQLCERRLVLDAELLDGHRPCVPHVRKRKGFLPAIWEGGSRRLA